MSEIESLGAIAEGAHQQAPPAMTHLLDGQFLYVVCGLDGIELGSGECTHNPVAVLVAVWIGHYRSYSDITRLKFFISP